jgi:hypothetical protein
MEKDNKHDGLGSMLRKGARKTSSPDLSATIMQKISVLENRRVYRRLAFTFVLKFVGIFLLVVQLPGIFLPWVRKMDLATELAEAPEKFSKLGSYLGDHPFYVLGLLAVVMLSGIIRLRAS